MNTGLIEHRGVIHRIEDGKAVVAMETGGCRSCGHGASCGIGKIAGERPATLLSLQSQPGLKVGDTVAVTLSERRLNRSALFGYLLPALGMLVGAWLGQALVGSDAASAAGACVGLCGALFVGRLGFELLPDLSAEPRMIPLAGLHLNSSMLSTESHHDHY